MWIFKSMVTAKEALARTKNNRWMFARVMFDIKRSASRSKTDVCYKEKYTSGSETRKYHYVLANRYEFEKLGYIVQVEYPFVCGTRINVISITWKHGGK